MPLHQKIQAFNRHKIITPYVGAVSDPSGEEAILPREVVKMSTFGKMSLARAWRKYLGLMQEEAAHRMGITQSAYAKIENGKARPRTVACKRSAAAMGSEWEQLKE